jgi:hypothetical protein
LTGDTLICRAEEWVNSWTYASAWWNVWTDRVVLSRAEPVTPPADRRRGTRAEMRTWIQDEIGAGLLRRAAIASGRLSTLLTPPLVRAMELIDSGKDEVLPSASALTFTQNVPFDAVEYAIPLGQLGEAMARIRFALGSYAREVTWPIEIRLSMGDDIPLSMAQGRMTAFVNFCSSPRHLHRSELLARFDGAFADLEARPHLGKIHFVPSRQMLLRYPDLKELKRVRETVDPTGVFSNSHVSQLLADAA